MDGTWPKMEALKESRLLCLCHQRFWLPETEQRGREPWQSWLDGGKTMAGFRAKDSPQKASVKGLRFADGARATGGVPGSRPCLLMSYLEEHDCA